MNYKNLLIKLSEYKKLNNELEQANLNYSNFKRDTQKDINLRFDKLANNIQLFCGSASFRSIINNFCYLYSNVLSVSGGNLAYRGSVPAPDPVHSENVFSIAEQCVNYIKTSLKLLSQNSGSAEATIKKLCVSFSTLRSINARIGELKEQALKIALDAENKRIDAIKLKQEELLKECPQLNRPEEIENQLSEIKQNISKEISQFSFENITVGDNYGKAVRLPFAKKNSNDEYDSGIKYWNPFKDGILHVNIPSRRYEIASDFIIALTMQFLHAYPLMKKQILYCCQNSLSKMDSFLKTLNDVCKDTVFFHGIEQIEADTFYQGIGDCLKNLRTEVKRRSSLIDATTAEDFYQYNTLDDADIISPVLVFFHDYPTGFTGCHDLGYFFRECARFGIFCVVLQTGFNKQGTEITDPATFKGIHCELTDDGNIIMNNDTYESVAINRANIAPLLKALMVNAEKGKKHTYLSYEDIGFGKTDKNADGYCTKISIPIGKINNKPFSLDFATSVSDEDKKKGIKTPLAYLVVGGPSSGKSTLIDSIIINGSMAYSPDDLIFYLLDFKDGVTASFYDGDNAIPHVRMIAAQSKEEDSDIILSGLISEKERRNELFKESGTADIASYNAKSVSKMPRIIVIVDECQNLFASDILAEKCEKLAREGRSAGIHLLLASQDAKLNMMQHAGKFIDGRFCYFTPSQSDAAQVISSEYTKSLNVDIPKGSGLAYLSLENGNNCQKIQVAFHGGDKTGNKAEYNRLIREKWKKVNYGINLIKAGEKSPLFVGGFTESSNPLTSTFPEFANIGENYFDHSTFSIDFSKNSSNSILLLGDSEEPSSDVLTSLITSAISVGGEIKLIDESHDLNLATFFGSHPSVTKYTKKEYSQVLKEVYAEFVRRKEDFRAKYKPYFFIINCLYRIEDYNNNKLLANENSVTADSDFVNMDIHGYFAKLNPDSSAENKILGKETLLEMLALADQANDFHIIIATNSNLEKYGNEVSAFSKCGYKILQKEITAIGYQIMENSFKEKMMEGLNENIVFISERGNFSKCRYFQYDWKDEKTQKLVVSAATQRITTNKE